MPTYQGSCHCGKVTFEFEGSLGPVLECNCSICSRKGTIWQATDDAHLRILSGKDELTLYPFGTRTAKHFFLQALWRKHVQQRTHRPGQVGCEPQMH